MPTDHRRCARRLLGFAVQWATCFGFVPDCACAPFRLLFGWLCLLFLATDFGRAFLVALCCTRADEAWSEGDVFFLSALA